MNNSVYFLGNVYPLDAWDSLKANKDAVLLDVRTKEEIKTFGRPDLSSLKKEVVFIKLKSL